jgi:hypothetical protein
MVDVRTGTTAKEGKMDGFTNNLAGQALGLDPSHFRKLRHYGVEPLADGGKWSLAQVLAVAVRVQARRVGATKQALAASFLLLSFADVAKLREAIGDGKKYLRLMGDVTDTNLVTGKCAFDPFTMAKATAHRLAYVVVDIEHWLAELDAVLERERKQVRERKALNDENEKRQLQD